MIYCAWHGGKDLGNFEDEESLCQKNANGYENVNLLLEGLYLPQYLVIIFCFISWTGEDNSSIFDYWCIDELLLGYITWVFFSC